MRAELAAFTVNPPLSPLLCIFQALPSLEANTARELDWPCPLSPSTVTLFLHLSSFSFPHFIHKVRNLMHASMHKFFCLCRAWFPPFFTSQHQSFHNYFHCLSQHKRHLCLFSQLITPTKPCSFLPQSSGVMQCSTLANKPSTLQTLARNTFFDLATFLNGSGHRSLRPLGQSEHSLTTYVTHTFLISQHPDSSLSFESGCQLSNTNFFGQGVTWHIA